MRAALAAGLRHARYTSRPFLYLVPHVRCKHASRAPSSDRVSAKNGTDTAPTRTQEKERERHEQDMSATSLVSATAEDLLKQRFLHAQKRSPGNTLMTGGSGTAKDMPSFFRDEGERHSSTAPDETSLMSMPSSQAPRAKQEAAPKPADASCAYADDMVGPIPAFQTPALSPIRRSDLSLLPDQPFDTHAFVQRLEDGGWKATRGDASARRHDPAEAIMDLTRALLRHHGETLMNENINRSDLHNQLYLFSSALSELRTEVRVRARNDAAALRSITLLLEREIDGLNQKLQSDIEQLKHDIQVEMNSRKTEVQEESNNLEQEIQDLNNRFTIFLSDLKTEIEQRIKWDATRRALALVFGIVAIMVCTLALADYFTRESAPADEEAQSTSPTPAKPRVLQQARVPVDHHTLEDDQDVALPPKSAEEWGLLPRYDADEVRHV